MTLDILLTGSDADEAQAIIGAFHAAGFQTPFHVVHRAEDAIDYLIAKAAAGKREKVHLPRLLLVGTRLPGNTASDVAVAIRQDPALRDLPIILLTESENPNDAQNKAKDSADFLVERKPPTLEALTELARKIGEFWLSSAPSTQANPARGSERLK